MNIVTANRLYELRKEHGMSQEELADKIGVSRQAISKWERAESSPDTDNLIALAKLYDISLDQLLDKEKVVNNKIVEENKIEDAKEDIKENKQHKKRGHITWLDSVVFISCIIIFLVLGFVWNYWKWCWLLLLVPIVTSSLFNAIEDKNPSHFAYPILMTIIYLFLGLAYPGGIWHPTWILFVTIPIYYSITSSIRSKNRKDDDEDEDDDDDDDDD